MVEIIDLCGDSDSEQQPQAAANRDGAAAAQAAAAASAEEDDEVQLIEPSSLKPQLADVTLGDDDDIAVVGVSGAVREPCERLRAEPSH